MLKYLSDLINRLKNYKTGITKNSGVWTGQPITPTTVQNDIDALTTIGEEIEALEDQLSQKKAAAQALRKEKELIADKIESLAIGFHKEHPEKLVDYNITTRKQPKPKPVPTKTLIPKVEDDVDGEGFILSNEVDLDADRYEWQKGKGADPKDTNTIPPMTFLKVTSKTTFVDDNVEKGERYFYRVRAVNRNGNGEWSQAVSKVQ